ncbi:IS5 family transposase [Bradyrhizobium sp. F1.13.1]
MLCAVGKYALIQHQRYAHAKQLKRANRALKTLRNYLGRVIRDIGRKIEGNGGLEAAFARPLLLARRVRQQQQRQRGPNFYSLHAPEVECIGKGEGHRPYEIGVKVSVATTLKHCKGGQFVIHVNALPGNPYDGHTLETVISNREALVGSIVARILADKGYRGRNAQSDHNLRVFLSGHKQGVRSSFRTFKARSGSDCTRYAVRRCRETALSHTASRSASEKIVNGLGTSPDRRARLARVLGSG